MNARARSFTAIQKSSGTPVFVGTRVPVKSLYDYFEAGDSLDGFLDSFPFVSHEQAIAALEPPLAASRRAKVDDHVRRSWRFPAPSAIESTGRGQHSQSHFAT